MPNLLILMVIDLLAANESSTKILVESQRMAKHPADLEASIAKKWILSKELDRNVWMTSPWHLVS